MKLGDVPSGELADRFATSGIALSLGESRVRVRSDSMALAKAVSVVYRHYPWEDPTGFFDATAAVLRVRGARRVFRPQIEFVLDGKTPFEPFPAGIHLPLMEWGLNVALTERTMHRLLLHSGAVERSGLGIVLPAIPGSGKSTLTAALVSGGGYRLLSDEFGVLSLETGELIPMLRPVSLKNASIDVIRRRFPEAELGPVFPGTRKGDVAHLAPPAESVARVRETVSPKIVIFPRYEANAPARWLPVDPAETFSKLSVNSFNYELLGRPAFDLVSRLVRGCVCRRLVFGDLADARELIDQLVDEVSAVPIEAVA